MKAIKQSLASIGAKLLASNYTGADSVKAALCELANEAKRNKECAEFWKLKHDILAVKHGAFVRAM